MNGYELAVLLSALLTCLSAACYVWYMSLEVIEPKLATWILVEMALVLSMWMYMTDPHSSWHANIGLVSGLFGTGAMLLAIAGVHVHKHTLHLAFDKTQICCLCAGFLIVFFWFVTNQRFLSYVLVQLVALTGYLATIAPLARATRNTEPMLPWILSLVASVLAVYPAIVMNESFAYIFLIRTIPSISFVIILMIQAERREREVSGVYAHK